MRIYFFLIAISLFYGCSKDKLVTIAGNTMGTYYVVKVVGEASESELKAKIDQRLLELNKIYSTYDKESELSLINSSEQVSFQLSQTLAKVISKALEIGNLTSGAFDITVGPLVNAWGFGPTGIQTRKPQQHEIQRLLDRVGYQKITLSGSNMTRPVGMYIDLSAIAKGHAVDEIMVMLKDMGFKSLLVEIGGEIRSQGKKNEKESWKIGIEQPVEESTVQRIIPIENMSIATSGSYRNYRKYGDQVFSHTINPVTGLPVEHQLISVSVLLPNCMDADAWATALMVLGDEKGLEITNARDIPAYFMVKRGDKVEVHSSNAFKTYLDQQKAEGK